MSTIIAQVKKHIPSIRFPNRKLKNAPSQQGMTTFPITLHSFPFY